MSQRYNEDFKKQVVKAYISSGKSTADVAVEYNVAKSSITQWVKKYHEECLYTTSIPESSSATEIRKLNKRIKEQEKEIEFLKKAAAFFAKEID